MEGPTPVSALLHAATMVTAGIFLVIRCSPLFEMSETILQIMVFFGSLTAIFSALVACFQNDIKKIIAYSTCSQLGYMFLGCGLSCYDVVIFHLFNHAFFKALLFLGAGTIIHGFFDEQDIRKMGKLQRHFPVTFPCILLGSLTLMGFPFLTGFFSKDLIIEFAYCRLFIDSLFLHFIAVSTAFFTGVYSCKILLFTFFFDSAAFKSSYGSIYKGIIMYEGKTLYLILPLVCLSIACICIGYLFSDLCVGLGTTF
jgi:NADH:ubiquinone oxidoreductase subunit 5 (subunit L)/multisubunit Na+/H+ antiporter MnhA subunit